MSHALASRARRGAHKITFAATMLQRRQLQGQAWHKPMLRERGRRPVTPRALANVLRCHTAWPSSAAPCLTRASAPQRMPSRPRKGGEPIHELRGALFAARFAVGCPLLSFGLVPPLKRQSPPTSNRLTCPHEDCTGSARTVLRGLGVSGARVGTSQGGGSAHLPARSGRADEDAAMLQPRWARSARVWTTSGRQWWIWELRRG